MDELAIDYKKLLHNKILEYAETHDNKLKDEIEIEIESMRRSFDIREDIALFDKICKEEAEKSWPLD